SKINRQTPGQSGGAPRYFECPTKFSEVFTLGYRANQHAPTSVLKFWFWRPAPLRAPWTPGPLLLPTSLCTSSLEMYQCFKFRETRKEQNGLSIIYDGLHK
ncbi:hypothetical protein MTR67_038649, partial [Solanum verrucosum]